MRFTFTKLLVGTSLLLLIGITAAITWVGKVYLFDLPNYQAYVVNMYKDSRLVGHSFPVVSIQTVESDTVYTEFAGTKGGIVLLFDPSACQPCLKLALKGLQHIYDNLEDPIQLPIYAISNTALHQVSQYRRVLKLKYDIGIPREIEEIDYFFERTPIIFLIDSHNTIIQCHHPIYNKDQFTILFFRELIFNHLPALRVNIEGFAESPLNNLVGLSLSEVIEGHHYAFDDPF